MAITTILVENDKEKHQVIEEIAFREQISKEKDRKYLCDCGTTTTRGYIICFLIENHISELRRLSRTLCKACIPWMLEWGVQRSWEWLEMTDDERWQYMKQLFLDKELYEMNGVDGTVRNAGFCEIEYPRPKLLWNG